jgi:hypothetical protein
MGEKFVYCEKCGGKVSMLKTKLLRRKYCSVCTLDPLPEKWSMKTSYLTGMLVSDGCLIRGNRRISFSNTNQDFMKTFLVLMETPRIPTIVHPKRGRTYEAIAVTDHGYYKFFQSLGLTPNKSLSLGPLSLPRGKSGKITHFGLFMRGVFEGDGHANLQMTERGTPIIALGITSGSRKFLTWLQHEISLSLNDTGFSTASKISQGNGAFVLRVPAMYVRALYQMMYGQYKSRSVVSVQTIVGLDSLGHTAKKAKIEQWLEKH